jgi:hypothetical protein
VRSGGLSYREAISFSIKPRFLLYTLLPTFGEDLALAFGGEEASEYIGYPSILAYLLALLALFRGRNVKRRFFIFLTALGFFLALGAYNPFYFLLYKFVPGFAFFRAPARWLYLYTFGVAMLSGMGAGILAEGRFTLPSPLPILKKQRRLLIMLICISLAILLFVKFPAPPSLFIWVITVFIGLTLIALRARGSKSFLLFVYFSLMCLELFSASRSLPYNHPTAPEAFSSLRTAPSHLLADDGLYRFISISDLAYDPGDLMEIRQIFEGQLSDKAIYDYVVATKRKEILTPNLPLLYKIQSVDGYDGGVLPLANYVNMMRLLLPEPLPDGRLREQLLDIPPSRLLGLFNVKYIITDKVYDIWVDDVYYDLGHVALLGKGATRQLTLTDLPDFDSTSLGVISYLKDAEELANGTPVAEVIVTDESGSSTSCILRAGIETAEGEYKNGVRHDKARVSHHWRDNTDGNYYVARLDLGTLITPQTISIRYLAQTGQLCIRGLSLIDERTETFSPLIVSTKGRFKLVHSGDVKIYENEDFLPRAFVVHRARVMENEAALKAMMEEDFNPAEEVILAEGESLKGSRGAGEQGCGGAGKQGSRGVGEQRSREAEEQRSGGAPLHPSTYATLLRRGGEEARVISYEPERVVIEANLGSDGYLVLTDAYYPGWRAEVDGKKQPILRAYILFRAVYLPEGEHTVEFIYDPISFKVGAAISLVSLLCVSIGLFGIRLSIR